MLEYGESEYVREFGLRVENELVLLEARILEAPKIQYGGNSQQSIVVSHYRACAK